MPAPENATAFRVDDFSGNPETYDVDAQAWTCTCEEWRTLRTTFSQRDVRRLCPHLLHVLHTHPNLLPGAFKERDRRIVERLFGLRLGYPICRRIVSLPLPPRGQSSEPESADIFFALDAAVPWVSVLCAEGLFHYHPAEDRWANGQSVKDAGHRQQLELKIHKSLYQERGAAQSKAATLPPPCVGEECSAESAQIDDEHQESPASAAPSVASARHALGEEPQVQSPPQPSWQAPTASPPPAGRLPLENGAILASHHTPVPPAMPLPEVPAPPYESVPAHRSGSGHDSRQSPKAGPSAAGDPAAADAVLESLPSSPLLPPETYPFSPDEDQWDTSPKPDKRAPSPGASPAPSPDGANKSPAHHAAIPSGDDATQKSPRFQLPSQTPRPKIAKEEGHGSWEAAMQPSPESRKGPRLLHLLVFLLLLLGAGGVTVFLALDKDALRTLGHQLSALLPGQSPPPPLPQQDGQSSTAIPPTGGLQVISKNQWPTADQAQDILGLIEANPTQGRYSITKKLPDSIILIRADLDVNSLYRVQRFTNGTETKEDWQGHTLFRLRRAAQGGSLVEVPGQPGQ